MGQLVPLVVGVWEMLGLRTGNVQVHNQSYGAEVQYGDKEECNV